METLNLHLFLLPTLFSSQLPKEHLLQTIPLMVTHLQAESTVQHTYAAHALERLFTMRGANNSTLYVHLHVLSYSHS